jgi:DsbC/DsbD-like thiol-disulfide interchange protein
MTERRKSPSPIIALACLAALSLSSLPASSSDWVVGAKSQARLLDGGVKDGVRMAGAQIRLSSQSITYWRSPGDAGAPPVWSFEGSANLGKAIVLFPQPTRIDEAGTEVFGYRDETLFPIAVTPRDASQPVHLQVSLDYAVCEAICLPVQARMQIDLPASDASPDADLVAKALLEAPRQLSTAQAAAKLEITPVAGAPKQWRLRWRPDDPTNAARDLFVEAPAGFYFESKPQGDNLFLLTLVEHPANKEIPAAPLRLTLSGQSPVEFDLTLP